MSELTGPEIDAAGLAGWVYLLLRLQTRIRTPDFRTGLALVDAIGAAAEEMDHHPDLDLRYTHVDVRTISHDEGRVTERDLRLARRISELAVDAGLRTESASVGAVEFALDSPDRDKIAPFWAAVMGAEIDMPDVADPAGALPLIWLQKSGSAEPRQRWHPDLWIEPAQVQPRIDAAVAAGGTLVSDAEAPSFWVLADPEGNKVCLCTWQNRSG
jgi:4a-hydroxytetrahydrobiopterin dehydratase